MQIEITDCGGSICLYHEGQVERVKNPFSQPIEDFAEKRRQGKIRKVPIKVDGVEIGSFWEEIPECRDNVTTVADSYVFRYYR